MTEEASRLLEQLIIPEHDKAYEISDRLGNIADEAVVDALIIMLKHHEDDACILAARTLGLIEVSLNEKALIPLLEAINLPENKTIAGELIVSLEGFDLSDQFVAIFKLYLFGSFKVSMIAKELLDYKEFTITPRVLKKSLKHWHHYTNNVKQDDAFLLRKAEVEEMLADIEAFLED